MLLFSYGANMASEEMARFSPESRFVGPARLDDHRLALRRRSRRWGGGAADVEPAQGEQVWGALYELPDDRLTALDQKEGEGHAYRRKTITVHAGDAAVEAQAYVVIEPEPAPVPATPEYAALLAAGARERGLPAAWIERLRTMRGDL